MLITLKTAELPIARAKAKPQKVVKNTSIETVFAIEDVLDYNDAIFEKRINWHSADNFVALKLIKDQLGEIDEGASYLIDADVVDCLLATCKKEIELILKNPTRPMYQKYTNLSWLFFVLLNVQELTDFKTHCILIHYTYI